MRRALLIEAVLQLSHDRARPVAVPRDAIAEIGEHATNDAVDLGRHRDLVLGGQRADHLEVASNRLLANRVRLTALAASCAPPSCSALESAHPDIRTAMVQSMANMRHPSA